MRWRRRGCTTVGAAALLAAVVAQLLAAVMTRLRWRRRGNATFIGFRHISKARCAKPRRRVDIRGSCQQGEGSQATVQWQRHSGSASRDAGTRREGEKAQRGRGGASGGDGGDGGGGGVAQRRRHRLVVGSEAWQRGGSVPGGGGEAMTCVFGPRDALLGVQTTPQSPGKGS